ncbi:LPD29 domain-containing protein [Streptomyces sp. NBC_01431]|uniref:LPD29 domain-containing protein n=1 Tax=Streptomyces sp. NBC_01431 TaxID=2903863 RepID=UPI002E349C6D|nr:LPD29 domain-containing protein [Streptomyces sp. NBC_01431]
MDYIDTKHVAAELKNRLKNAFPSVKFSVRKDTGTASAWISVHWTDGPSTADVGEHTRPMQGAQFNGMETATSPPTTRSPSPSRAERSPVNRWSTASTPTGASPTKL